MVFFFNVLLCFMFCEYVLNLSKLIFDNGKPKSSLTEKLGSSA